MAIISFWERFQGNHHTIEPADGHIIVALLNNDPLCKRLVIRGKSMILKSENPKYLDHHIMEGDEFSVWV